MKNKRTFIQIISAAFFNGYIVGFFKSKIYTGSTKQICVPVLNCYSCPGALGACPIGSMQAVLGDSSRKLTFYALGMVMLFGVLFGRLICGFLCPFGFIQDLLYKIRSPKISIPKKIDKSLRYLKYAILLVFVILLPLLLTNKYGYGVPYFCKFICPVGTLEGGIPLVLGNKGLRAMIGQVFSLKIIILIVIVIASVFIYRPFCKYICPLGAFYALFNKISFFTMGVDKNKCVGCKVCEKNCNMGVEITKNINSTECIRCGKCKTVCVHDAINFGVTFKSSKTNCDNK